MKRHYFDALDERDLHGIDDEDIADVNEDDDELDDEDDEEEEDDDDDEL